MFAEQRSPHSRFVYIQHEAPGSAATCWPRCVRALRRLFAAGMSLTPFLRGVVLRLYGVLGALLGARRSDLETCGPLVRPKWPAVDGMSLAAARRRLDVPRSEPVRAAARVACCRRATAGRCEAAPRVQVCGATAATGTPPVVSVPCAPPSAPSALTAQPAPPATTASQHRAAPPARPVAAQLLDGRRAHRHGHQRRTACGVPRRARARLLQRRAVPGAL